MAGKRTNAERLERLEQRIDDLFERLDEAAESGQRPVIIRHEVPPPVRENPRQSVQSLESSVPPWWHQPPPWAAQIQQRPSESSESLRVALDYVKVFMPLLRTSDQGVSADKLIELVLMLSERNKPAPPPSEPPESPIMKLLENPLAQAALAQKLGIDREMVAAFVGGGEEVGEDALAELLGPLAGTASPSPDSGGSE